MSDVTIGGGGAYVTITNVGETPVSGDTGNAIASGWAYDHAADLDAHTLMVRKTSNEIVNNSNTLQADDELLFAVAANEVWTARFIIYYISALAADIQFSFDSPAGSVGSWTNQTRGLAPGSYTLVQAGSLGTSGGPEIAVLTVIIRNGANAGNLTLKWAQVTADVSDTTVYLDSCVLANRIF